MKPNSRRKERRGADKRLYAPGNGRLRPLSSAADPVFASRQFGEGIAMSLSDEIIVSPCSGTVVMVPYTKHSVGLENEHGDMVLVHIGTNAEQFRGRGFETLAAEGTKVRPGVPLIRIDRKFLEAQNADLTVCMVVTNQNKGVWHVLEGETLVGGRTAVMERKGA